MNKEKISSDCVGFEEEAGRKPIAGQDFDPDNICQDDYEYLTSSGHYTLPAAIPPVTDKYTIWKTLWDKYVESGTFEDWNAQYNAWCDMYGFDPATGKEPEPQPAVELSALVWDDLSDWWD